MNELIDTFANRLSKIITIRNIKPIELSEKTGINKSKISSYMSGRYKAKQDGIHILSKVLNVDPAWLMGYDVPMERELENKEKNDNIFLYSAKDSSMLPLLDVGDIATVKKTDTFKNGDTCLVSLDNNEIIRKILDFKDYIELHTIFSNKPERLTKEDMRKRNFKILGKVIKAENESYFK